MHLGLISGGNGWHIQDLIKAAERAGHTTHVYDFREMHTDTAFPAMNVIRTMPAGSLEQIVFRMDVLHRAHRNGIRFANHPRVIEICVDKFLTDVYLHESRILTPRAFVCQRAEAAMHYIHDYGCDIVVKPIFGSEGRGMMRITDQELAWRCFRAIEQTGGVIYLQEYIHNPGWDYRVFVIGDQVVAAMKRFAQNDWRTNIAQGGRAEKVHLTSELEQLAISASRAIGCDYAGVDIIQDLDHRWFVLEVNGVPGWRAISEVCHVDIASLLIQYVTQ